MKPPFIIVASAYYPELRSAWLEGVAKYCSKFGSWRFQLLHLPAGPETDWARVDFSAADGVLALNAYAEMEKRIVRSGKPAVALDTAGHTSSLPAVAYDETAIGRIAGEHLANLGLKHLAFAGFHITFSRKRGEGFFEAIRLRGLPAPRCIINHFKPDWENPMGPIGRRIAAWIDELEKPAGVFCANDLLAILVIQACQKIGVKVPEQVSVVGVDNLIWRCETAPVPLSSVERDDEQAGYQAADLLSRLLRGENVMQRTIRIPPAGVITRRSTDVLDPEHPELAQAIHFIRDHACDGITIHDLLSAVPISRRSLHRLFQQFLGSSPGEEIQRHRLERAKTLLIETDISISDIASRCGFGWSHCLCRAFKSKYQVTPAVFRRQARTAQISTGAQ